MSESLSNVITAKPKACCRANRELQSLSNVVTSGVSASGRVASSSRIWPAPEVAPARHGQLQARWASAAIPLEPEGPELAG
jgi:hypothetical protein